MNHLLQVLPNNARSAVRGTFDLMEIAEEEIKAGQRRHPRKAQLINESFKLLCPPTGFWTLDPQVYRSHARELIERVGWTAGGDPAEQVSPKLATRAEILVCLMEQSLKAPLTADYAAMYEQLFVLVMGRTVPGEATRFSGHSGHTQASLFAELRRTCNRRGA